MDARIQETSMLAQQIAKHRWYLARYQQVNGQWETQVLIGKSWDALWKARRAAREHGDNFTPFRGEVLKQQKRLTFLTETGDPWLPKEGEAA